MGMKKNYDGGTKGTAVVCRAVLSKAARQVVR
jgi:hypothetical protein